MVTRNDALKFVKTVKDKFEDKPEIYKAFLHAMIDFKYQRLCIFGVVRRIKELFKDHQDLILGFNLFMPDNFTITPQPSQKKLVDFEEIQNKVKVRFQDNITVYHSFLDLLNIYIAETMPLTDLCFKVAHLLWDHLDLYLEFLSLIYA